MPNTSRARTLWTSVLSFALVAALSACAMDDESIDEGTASELTFDAVSPVNPNDLESVQIDARLSGYGQYFGDGNVCECDSQECVVNFINDNFGCQICVSFQCNQGSVHACNPCDESLDPVNAEGVTATVRR